MIWTVDFYIKGKTITLDESTLPPEGIIDYNTGYYARFHFTEEWESRIIVARFANGHITKDMVLDGSNTCEFPPEVMRSNLLEVGVFTKNNELRSSNKARVPIIAGTLTDDGLPVNPSRDVFEQILDKVNEIQDEAISPEDIQAAVDAYMEANPVEIPTVTVKTWTEEDFAEGEES